MLGGRFLIRMLFVGLVALTAACANPKSTTRDTPADASTGTVVGVQATPSQTTSRPSLITGPPPSQEVGSPEPDAERAYAHLQKLAVEIGSRPSGTPQEQAAADYIAEEFRRDGYTVEMQRFPVNAFIVRSTSLTVEGANGRALQVQPYTMSRGGSATGEVVFSGLGRAGEFPAAVRGAIALVERGEIPFREKAANAAQAGATALVIYNNAPDLQVGTLQTDGPPIPVLAISGTDGQRLRADMAAGAVRLSLQFDGGSTQSDSINVVARPNNARCRVVVGGHYDSVALAAGASDNASGTAAVLEMARATAAAGNPGQACFVAFASEETGLDGSRAFVQSLTAEDRDALQFMLNFDMVAVGTEWLLIGTPTLQEQARVLLDQLRIPARPTGLRSGSSSDHASFIEAGIPALMVHRADDPLLHTPEDEISRISKADLGESLRIGLALLEQLKPV